MSVNFTIYVDKFFHCDFPEPYYTVRLPQPIKCKMLTINKNQCMDLSVWAIFDLGISSIDPLGNCIIIWEHPDCEGDSKEIDYGVEFHNDLSALNMTDGRRKWEDEMSSISACPDNYCTRGAAKCRNKKCINAGWICDGENDCEEGEDEINCPIHPSGITPETGTKFYSYPITVPDDQVSPQVEITMPPRINCSINETYCERNAKCVPYNDIDGSSKCDETDINIPVLNSTGQNRHPGPFTPTKEIILPLICAIAILVLVFAIFGIYVRLKKRKSRTSNKSDVPLYTLPQELQLLLPPSPPSIPLPSPWKSNPSLICQSLLGEGSFGKVYQAEDLTAIVPPTSYAIKCINMLKTLETCSGPSSGYISSTEGSAIINLQNSMTKLLTEMQIMDKLSSDHVVRYYGCWAEAEDCSQLLLTKSRLEEYIHELMEHCNNSMTSGQNSPHSHIFIRMELCHTTLKHYLPIYTQRSGDAISIIRQIACGLLYVHSKGYIHRDIKPGNIFCKVESGDNVTWKIGDFGLAVETKEGGNLVVAGTHLYRSPQMRRGLKYTVKTDLYSLGLVGVEILHMERKKLNKFDVFSDLLGLGEIERRKYLNNCCWGDEFKKLVSVVNKLLNVDEESRICSRDLCKLLMHADSRDVFKSV